MSQLWAPRSRRNASLSISSWKTLGEACIVGHFGAATQKTPTSSPTPLLT
jgi:hypothetical protein